MAQDDYYYEIQLTNKQLVFYFMAGATGLILSFLAGVMVGRGVDAAAGAEVQAAKPIREERIVAEEAKPAAPSPEELTYAKQLEADKPDDTLDRGKGASKEVAGKSTVPKETAKLAAKEAAPNEPAAKNTAAKEPAAKEPAAKEPAAKEPAAKEPAAKEPAGREAAAKPPKGKAAPDKSAGPSLAETKPVTVAAAAPPPTSPAGPPSAAPATNPAKPAVEPAPSASKPAHAPPGSFTIQVGAFKDHSSAESVVTRLKTKGFAAYVFSPEGTDGGLFNVRVGSFTAKAEAERVQSKLRDEEKFKPFIVKN